jgi:DNA-binding winged helix-turn-helix (wHTH) protein
VIDEHAATQSDAARVKDHAHVLTDAVLVGPDGLRLDPHRRIVTVHGVVVRLQRREFDLLEILMQNLGRVVPYSELAQSAWGYEAAGDQRFIYTAAWRLRRALAAVGADDLFESLRGVGYSIREPLGTEAQPIRGYAILDPDHAQLPLVMVSESIEDLRGAGGQHAGPHARATAHLRHWSSDDCERIRGGVRDAVSTGHAALHGLRWLREGGTSTLDMDLVRLEGGNRRLVLCDITAVVVD